MPGLRSAEQRIGQFEQQVCKRFHGTSAWGSKRRQSTIAPAAQKVQAFWPSSISRKRLSPCPMVPSFPGKLGGGPSSTTQLARSRNCNTVIDVLASKKRRTSERRQNHRICLDRP